MSGLVDRHSRTELSTSAVPAADAFTYWRDMICATFVRLDAAPVGEAAFAGRIEYVPLGDLEMSTVTAGGQRVRRTRTLVARDDEEYLLASIQLNGRGQVEQDDRVAPLSAGDVAFYDSTRPYTLHFDDSFTQLVVQVPKAALSVTDTRALTACRLGRSGPGGVVAAFFTSLQQSMKDSPAESTGLLQQGIGLLSTAAGIAGRAARPDAAGVDALTRLRVLDFIRAHLDDPGLGATQVALRCGVSRRTLYRVFDGEGVAARIRAMRIERAKQLLLASPHRPVGRVGAECGFASESGFHRAFRAATGHTPAQYRQLYTCGMRSQ